MKTELIELKDGTLVEVESIVNTPKKLSSKNARKASHASLNKINDFLVRFTDPILNTLDKITSTKKLDQIEIDLGLSFEGEGNLFITKAKASANVNVKMIFKMHLN